MENVPMPSTQDANLRLALLLLNREIEELKKKVAALEAAGA